MSHAWDYDAIRRAHRTLRKQLQHVEGLVSIGFGCARKRGVVDSKRPFAVCVYLRNKRARVPKRERIPEVLELRLLQHARYEQVGIASDVVHCPRGMLTGRVMRTPPPQPQFATLGPVLRWEQQTEETIKTRFAFLTVAHPLRTIPIGSVVQIATASGTLNQFGVLLARSPSGSGQDAALIEVTPRTLQKLQPKVIGRVRVASNRELLERLGSSGTLLRSDGSFPFRWGVYHPKFESIFQLGPLRDMFEGFGTIEDQFGPGTSGAAWADGSQLASLQTAGLLAGQFRNGLGQSIVPLIQWSLGVLARSPGWVAGSLEVDSVY